MGIFFPSPNASEPTAVTPECDFWFRVDTPGDTYWVILHVLFCGTWAELKGECTGPAQVIARFATRTEVKV
jgi:hypothetical protein